VRICGAASAAYNDCTLSRLALCSPSLFFYSGGLQLQRITRDRVQSLYVAEKREYVACLHVKRITHSVLLLFRYYRFQIILTPFPDIRCIIF
jgi:hypothetical protein